MTRAVDRILFHGKKLNRAPAFAQGFLFPSQSGIDQTKHASVPGRHLVEPEPVFSCSARAAVKAQLRFVLVFCHASDNAFHERRVTIF